MENNRAERVIRPVAMGRANWLFAGALAAGERAAQLMRQLETAKMNGLEPHVWLTGCAEASAVIAGGSAG